jgi:uncharacterized membrane protein YidH (DUF202 family)
VFGFVVAKFGIALREMLRARAGGEQGGRASLAIGIAFIAMGVLMALTSAIRYRKTMEQLKAGKFAPANEIITLWGIVAAMFGLILTGYLLYTARGM